ncbi:MAG TPA: hypothetical protein VNG31_06370 [Candidatus Baltobacteraceae bacterium]|nr:hypothetical protein [Candidatus Baltobacteraceae bacterium]
MGPQISPSAFNQFFGFAPIVIGIVIYLAFYVAKRTEVSGQAVPFGQTFACAGCGRRGPREHMVPREHSGAVSWYCSRCASV